MKKFFMKYFILILMSGVLCRCGMGSSIPNAVALGGAIVAAVEEEAEVVAQAEAESEAEERKDVQQHHGMANENGTSFIHSPELHLHERMDEGRGKKYKKYHKKHKLMKHLYPLLLGSVIAKAVIIPLVLKALTALSTSSFIMAKIALAASGLIVLKWLFADSGNERTRFEIVSLPTKNSDRNGGDWNGDMSWSGSSNFVDIKPSTPKQRLKYIPFVGSSSSSGNTFLLNKGIDANDYHYGYDNPLDNKPFL